MKRNKSIENILLIIVFVFASIGAYVLFANPSSKEETTIEAQSLYVKDDFSKYNTAKPKLKNAKKVGTR